MIYEIPTDIDATSWEQETEVDGRTYKWIFRYNSREAYWYLTIKDLDDVVIAGGLKIVPGADLLRHIKGDDRPLGELIVIGTPTEDTLKNGGFVFYVEE